MNTIQIQGGGLLVEVNATQESLTIYDFERSERLLILPNLNLCLPVFDRATNLVLQGVQSDGDRITLVLQDELCRVEVFLSGVGDALELRSETSVNQACELTRLAVFPRDTALNLYDVVNFRNRHYTAQTWPEQVLGGEGCKTDTYSGDWQFAPHPTLIMLRKNETTLCLGALDIPTAFGMYFAASDYRLEECSLDYGQPGYGQELTAGNVFHSPRFCLFLDRNRTPYQTVERCTNRLIAQKYIPQPAAKIRHAWHREPLYCTWMDQGYVSGFATPDELGQQQLSSSNPTVEACSEPFVRQILHRIEEKRLPFRTILLDDGWQVTRGQWEPHPLRFPDLRSLVDDIHAQNRKVIVWWNWAEVFADAEAEAAHLAGTGWVNRHGLRMRDYSHPRTQREYLEPLFYKFFSSDEGCYDLDGIKTDFLADKIHPETPLYDRAWRGEENYCYRLFQLFYTLMRRFKSDACHIGCAGHPYLAEFIDINRTYDVATSNVEEHVNRRDMLVSTTPGCPVAFDLHNYVERFEEYFQRAQEVGASVQVGNILGMKRDRCSEWEPADDAFYEIIRRGITAIPERGAS